jgi:hypothetical protein
MKKLSSLILVVGIIINSYLISTSKPAFAYCVYNKSDISIHGADTRRHLFDKYWNSHLAPGARDCCPGSNSECQNATIRIVRPADNARTPGNRVCQVQVGASQALVVTNKGKQLFCKVKG